MKCGFCGHEPRENEEVAFVPKVPGDWAGMLIPDAFEKGDIWKCPNCNHENTV